MRKGFTLLELMIVIFIMGILAAFISSNFMTSLKKGRDAQRKGDLNAIQKALEMYYEDKKVYPDNLTFGGQLTDEESGKIYMQKVPSDPTSLPDYEYETDENHTYYKLYACLENSQQQLSYTSSPSDYTCTRKCKLDDSEVNCIWGISSSNTAL